MKTVILALATVATLGLAVPAFAQEGTPRAGAAIDKVSAQDFSSRHRYWRRHHHHRWYWRHHHRRHHHWRW